MDEENSTQVSVVIPVYNGAATVALAIKSVLNQTGCQVQVVVVDDGSTDDSAKVVEDLAKADGRIVLVRHDGNKGRLEARRSGFAACAAPYIMFLDADDTFAANAVSTCLNQKDEQGSRFDIVQLGFELRYIHYVDSAARTFDFEFCQPPECDAFGEEVPHVTFARRLGPWSMCGKMFKREVLEQAFAHIAPAAMQTAEDACIYFLASYYAQSFRGVPACLGYIYNIDAGGSDAKWKQMDANQFAYSCGYIDAMQQIRRFLNSVEDGQTYEHDFDVLFHEHACSVADKLLHNVQPDAVESSFCRYAESWPVSEVVACIAENELLVPDEAWRKLGDSACLQAPAHPIKTIAAYHNRLESDGAEVDMLQLAALWQQAGYAVVLIADAGALNDEVVLPKGMQHVEIVPFEPIDAAGIRTRLQQLEVIIETYHIDALVYHQWRSPLLSWDMMLSKLKGVPVLVHAHSSFRMLYSQGSARDLLQQVVLRYVDGMAVSGTLDKRYWSEFNPRVWQTQDPITLSPIEEQQSAIDSGSDYRAFWTGVFDELAQGSVPRTTVCGDDMLWDVVLDGCKDSLTGLVLQRDEANAEAQVQRIRADQTLFQLDEERASMTHKLGSALLYVPCKLKDMFRR